MHTRQIVQRETAYLVLNAQGDRIASYATESEAHEAAVDALSLLGGGQVTRVDGSIEVVPALEAAAH